MDCLAPVHAERHPTAVSGASAAPAAVDAAQLAAPASPEARVLSFSAGGSEFAIDIRCVREIRTAEPVTRVPGGPAALRGVIDLRGAVVPVMDLACHIGASSMPDGVEAVIVVELGGRLVGLQVDAVDDVILVNRAWLRAVPPLAHTPLAEHLLALIAVGERLLQWVDMRSLLQDAPHAAAATAGTPHLL